MPVTPLNFDFIARLARVGRRVQVDRLRGRPAGTGAGPVHTHHTRAVAPHPVDVQARATGRVVCEVCAYRQLVQRIFHRGFAGQQPDVKIDPSRIAEHDQDCPALGCAARHRRTAHQRQALVFLLASQFLQHADARRSLREPDSDRLGVHARPEPAGRHPDHRRQLQHTADMASDTEAQNRRLR